MPSEREIRKLYVNGLTICIEFFFCHGKIFSVRRTRSRHRMGTILGAWGESLNKHFGRCNPAKIAKHVYVCIACQSVKIIKLRKNEKVRQRSMLAYLFCITIFSIIFFANRTEPTFLILLYLNF